MIKTGRVVLLVLPERKATIYCYKYRCYFIYSLREGETLRVGDHVLFLLRRDLNYRFQISSLRLDTREACPVFRVDFGTLTYFKQSVSGPTEGPFHCGRAQHGTNTALYNY